jgi:hypothetical protein
MQKLLVLAEQFPPNSEAAFLHIRFLLRETPVWTKPEVLFYENLTQTKKYTL